MTEKIGEITLDYSCYSGEDLYCDGSVEEELLRIVKEHAPEDYPRLIEESGSWPVLYHLSPLRGNIAEWIPMEPGCKALEVGSGCGAITGTLARKAGEVTCVDLSRMRSTINAWRNRDCGNVTIHVGNFQDIEPRLAADYDYIFLIGAFEYGQGYIQAEKPYETMMRILKKHLKPSGRIVIAIENKFGLKYWAGCREDHTGRYFSGLEDYPEGGVARTFTRKGLEAVCAAAQIDEYAFYYPYPDYKFPMAVYSDERLPRVGELANNICNFDRSRMLLFDEKSVFDTILREGVFPLFSNSYLLITGKPFPVCYVKYSNDRAERFRIRTDICTQADGSRFVRKVPLSAQAAGHVRGIFLAGQKLTEKYEKGRLSVNRCRQTKDGVALEYLRGHTLEELLDERLDAGDEAGFFRLVDEYVEAVSFREEEPVTDYDLIFSNIIVSPEGFWTVLDYEWTFLRACPGRLIAGRALHCYLTGAVKRRGSSLRYLKERLGFTEEQIGQMAQDEAEFQQFVTGSRLSMGKLHEKSGCPVLPAEYLTELAAAGWAYRRVQIYLDTGSGFSEDASWFVEDAYPDRDCFGAGNEISFSVSLPGEAQAVRIDPGMACCLLDVRRLTLESGTASRDVPAQACAVNGTWISQTTVLFDSRDPNLTIRLSAEQAPAGEKTLHAEFLIAPLPDALAARAGEGFPKPERRKRRRKERGL